MDGLGRIGTPVWLDVTRLVRRVGRGPLTGIDRVEVAYLRHLCALRDADTRFLCRTTRGVLLLGRSGGECLLDMVKGAGSPHRADIWSRIAFRGDRMRHRVEATLRPHATDRSLHRMSARLVARNAPPTAPLTYLNVGHVNLSERMLAAFRNHRTVAMVHDLIPIRHPDLVASDMPARFARRLAALRSHADIILCNSEATRADLRAYWSGGPTPEIRVARLGLDIAARPPRPDVPTGFVMLGTIEPRKNHALMLDAWDILARAGAPGDLPQLHIIGQRGWRVDALMARLDSHPLRDRAIFVHGAMSDTDVATRLSTAHALLFPSLAEGYGFPPLEALARGTMPVVADLPVLRETLGPRAFYLPTTDANRWAETIAKLLDGSLRRPDISGFAPPCWKAHFETVGRALARGPEQGP